MFEASLRRRSGGCAPFTGARQASRVDAIWASPRISTPHGAHSRAPQWLESGLPEVRIELPRGHSMRDRLTALATARPNASVMAELASIDPASLCGEDAITWLQAHERLISWWASLQAPAIVRAAGADRFHAQVVAGVDILGDSATGHITIADAVREEISAALRLSPATAQARIDSARLLCGPLRATHMAQSGGRITPSHAAIIVSAAARLRGVWDDDDAARAAFDGACEELQRRVLPVAMRSTLARTRQAAKHAVIAVDPLEAQRRRIRSLSARDVFVIDDLDGVSTLVARMATEHAHACLSVINRHAKQGDRRSAGSTSTAFDIGSVPPAAGERRSLALAALLLDEAPRTGPAREGVSTIPDSGTQVPAPGTTGLVPRVRAHVNLVIDLPTLLALRDGTAELTGAGAIPAEVVRDLLDDAVMRRMITDPTTGELLDYGRRTYAVPQRLREFIAARDRMCRFPGCGTVATRCQIDHAIPWSRGGETNRDNLGALCVRHHQLKTHGGWTITESDSHGGCTWLSPQGRRYEHVPTPSIESPRPALSQTAHEGLGPPHPGDVRFPAATRDGPT